MCFAGFFVFHWVIFLFFCWFVLLCWCCVLVWMAAGRPDLLGGGLNRTYYWGVGGFMGGPLGSSHFDSFGTGF